jgi:hypothetical protein
MLLRGRWCHVTALNVHAQTEDKIDDMKDSFYKKLEGAIIGRRFSPGLWVTSDV